MLEQILASATEEIKAAVSLKELQQVKVSFLGKQSPLNQEMKKLGSMAEEERKKFGQEINNVKQQISELISMRESFLEEAEMQERFEKEKLDLSLPPRFKSLGSVHPITQVLEEMLQILSKFGFMAKDGPNIETDWYNFTALNMDENHPARQMHDTFYLKSGNVLRTHTSPIQIRTMENSKPPFRFIAPGRVFRSDSDMTHTPMFHQIEGVVVDKSIHMGHLKYVIIELINQFFEQDGIEVRFRPSFFPFTEPSAEVDIKTKTSGKWLEVLGCGMIHPKVLENVNLDPKEYSGFAFGLGLERFAMLKYNIKDLRQFFESDKRWLDHYNFSAFDIPSLIGGLTR